MKWRIAEKKLLFVRKIMLKEESNIARKALLNETFMRLKGLIHECFELTEMMGIPDIMTNLVLGQSSMMIVGDGWRSLAVQQTCWLSGMEGCC